MTDQPSMSVAELLQIMRRDAIMRKAIDPSAPDPDVVIGRLEDWARRYPPIQKGDGYDFMPLVKGVARETGQDKQVLAAAFRRAADSVATDRAAAVDEAEDILHKPLN